MRYILLLAMLLAGIFANTVTNTSKLAQGTDPAYQAAYERWSNAINANPRLGPAFWLRTDTGPADLRNAISELLSFGPNLTPFIVDEMKKEKDYLRLYRLVLLLDKVSGVNLYFGSDEENFYEAAPRFRDRFVEDWDSGKYLHPEDALSKVWQYSSQDEAAQRVDPGKLAQIRRYGVFAVPFIIENMQKYNSPELFAAFLIITDQTSLYTEYIENPSGFFAARGQKLSYLKAWAARNESRLNKLTSLHQRIKELTDR